MKKSIYILVIFAMVLAGVACGKADLSTKGEESGKQAEEEQVDEAPNPGEGEEQEPGEGEEQESGEGEAEETDIPFSKYALDGDISTWPNATYGGIVSGSLQWNVGYDYTEEPEIIILNSDEEMAVYADSEYAPVDFSTKTLLLAYGCEWTLNLITDVGLKQVAEQHYVMNIDFQISDMTAIYFWRVPIVVDKLPEGSEVELELKRDYPTE